MNPRLPTFDMLREPVDDLVAADAIEQSLEVRVRQALDQAERWTMRPVRVDRAQATLEQAILHLHKEADKAEDRPRRGSSDPEALRALADYLQEKVDDLDGAP